MPKDCKPPYFPFYPDDFASDGKVEAMPTEAVGAYILLLCKAWREEPPGSIPDNDVVLARWTRLTHERWMDMKQTVLAAFTLGTDQRWHQKRLRSEFVKFREHQNKRSKAGQQGAQVRWQSHSNANGNRIAMPMRFDAISSSSPPPPSESPPNPQGGREPPNGEAKAQADARTFARNWCSANYPCYLRPGLLATLERLIGELGQAKAVERVEEAIAAGKTANPFAYVEACLTNDAGKRAVRPKPLTKAKVYGD